MRSSSNNNFVMYSYTSFKKNDLIYEGFTRYKDIKKLDYIDFTEYDNYNDLLNNIIDLYMDYKSYAVSTGTVFDKFVFKEFCCRSKDKIGGDMLRYYKFKISDWNEDDREKGIDTRNLTIDLYSYNRGTRVYESSGSYRVKIDHIYQMILDLERYCRYFANEVNKDPSGVADANFYVLPIFLYYDYTNTDNEYFKDVIFNDGKYRRISDEVVADRQHPWTNKVAQDELSCVLRSLYLFTGTNYSIYKIMNSEEKYKIHNNKTNRSSNDTVRHYVARAKDDREIKIDLNQYLNKQHSININIDTSKNNIIVESVPRKLCDYKFQVKGHYSHYWVKNSEGKLVREKRWIDSYYKNADKEFAIVKEYV